MPLEVAQSMQARAAVKHGVGALPPSTHPKLGVQSKHKEFRRYALQRIFRPFLVDGRSD
jgi:hypothetical protein